MRYVVRQWFAGALVVAALTSVVAGCGSDQQAQAPAVTRTAGPGPAAGARSVAAQVWSQQLGFVSWPALPEKTPGKAAWTLPLATTFQSGKYALPSLPDADGRIAGVTSSGQLLAYDGTGHKVWSTALPKLSGAALLTVSELQVPGLTLFAVVRDVTSTEDRVDVFDGVSGKYLWSRTGARLVAPKLLDAHRLLFEASDDLGVTDDAVDARTGKLLWHKDVDACQVFPGHLLCDASDGIALVDPTTGEVDWQVSHAGTESSYTAIVDGVVYLSDGATLTAVDLATGAVRWQQTVKIAQVDTVAPLDADHVLLAGLSGSAARGWTKEADSVTIADGTERTLYTSSSMATPDATKIPTNVIAVNGTRYVLVIDPDGTAHTLTAQGTPVASANAACLAPHVVGDTLACTDQYLATLYTVPALSRRTAMVSTSLTAQSFDVIGTNCVIQNGETVTGLANE